MKELDQITGTFPTSLNSASILESELVPPTRQTGWLEDMPQWRNQTKLSTSGLERILVIQLDNIADMVMTGPALRTLRETLPHAEITLLTSPAGNQVVPLMPWIDKSMVCDALWQDISGNILFDPQREMELVRQLQKHQFQLAIIFTSFSQSPFPAAYACYLAGIPHRLGFSKEFGGNVLSLSPAPPSDEIHQVDRNLHLLEQLNIPMAHNSPLELEIPSYVQKSADELLASVGVKPDMPFIVLAPGESWASRRYDPQRFAAATRLLAMQTTLPLIILGSAQETEHIRPIIEVAEDSSMGSVRSLVGRTTVPEFVAIIERASLTIGENSAAMHIADALQSPMVILYSGSNLVNQWKPRYAPARLLCRPVFCSPCYNFECPYQMECLDIRPQEVVSAALEMLTGKFYSHIPLTEIKVTT